MRIIGLRSERVESNGVTGIGNFTYKSRANEVNGLGKCHMNGQMSRTRFEIN